MAKDKRVEVTRSWKEENRFEVVFPSFIMRTAAKSWSINVFRF